MAKEKVYYEAVLTDLQKKTDKITLGVTDVMKIMKFGYSKAFPYMKGEKTITIYQLASRLLD